MNVSTGSEKRTNSSMSNKAITVRGPIDPSQLGVTIVHEHILLGIMGRFGNPGDDTPVTDAALWTEKLTLENLHFALAGKSMADLSHMSDVNVAIEEVSDFRDWGGNTIVDVSPIGVRRDPLAFRRISYATGINVIMGTGFYSKVFPPDMDQRSVEDLSEEIIRDITVGIHQTDIKAGIIGEVGVEGNPITPNEVKSIKAAARASRATGAPISFHRAGIGREKLEVISIVGEEGADLTRTIMGHCDWIAGDVPLLLEMLKHGVYAAFDVLGQIGTALSWNLGRELTPPFALGDANMVAQAIMEITGAGYEDRIVLSQDVGTKTRFKRYGGTGFSYLLEQFIPHLRRGGITEEQTYKFMVENPKRVLSFASPM